MTRVQLPELDSPMLLLPAISFREHPVCTASVTKQQQSLVDARVHVAAAAADFLWSRVLDPSRTSVWESLTQLVSSVGKAETDG